MYNKYICSNVAKILLKVDCTGLRFLLRHGTTLVYLPENRVLYTSVYLCPATWKTVPIQVKVLGTTNKYYERVWGLSPLWLGRCRNPRTADSTPHVSNLEQTAAFVLFNILTPLQLEMVCFCQPPLLLSHQPHIKRSQGETLVMT